MWSASPRASGLLRKYYSRFFKGTIDKHGDLLISVHRYCHCLGTGNPANSGFQLYTLVKETTVAGIPDSITFEEASVLPQAISTAAAGLFLKESLDLPIPPPTGVKPTGKSIIIWGGASSVGATTIQLAVAAGLTVITTASAHNHKLVKSLGATAVFDYKSPTVVDDVVNALTNTEFIGVYDAISEPTSLEMVRAVLDQLNADVKTICVIPYDNPTERFAPIFSKAPCYNIPILFRSSSLHGASTDMLSFSQFQFPDIRLKQTCRGGYLERLCLQSPGERTPSTKAGP